MFFALLDRAGPDVTVTDEKLAVDVQEEVVEREKENKYSISTLACSYWSIVLVRLMPASDRALPGVAVGRVYALGQVVIEVFHKVSQFGGLSRDPPLGKLTI